MWLSDLLRADTSGFTGKLGERGKCSDMVSMKDIAKECGVSVATVSKALNDYSDIGKLTRDRVRKTAQRLGYFPNSSARALKTKRTFNLGVLFVDEANSGLTHDFFSHVLESFKVTAESKGYDITFTSANMSNRRMSYLEHCKYRGVDGVVIACIDFNDPSVQELVMSDLSVVTIDHVFANRIAVSSDNLGGMKQLVDYVCRQGHRKIAFMHGADSSVTRSRMNGFYCTMAEHGCDVIPDYLIECPYRDVEMANICTERLLSLPDPPTCILYPDDLTCIGSLYSLTERGLEPGKGISVAGYDGTALSEMIRPHITTVWQDTKSIGRISAEKLISLIENPKTTVIDHSVISSRLVEGSTVAKI